MRKKLDDVSIDNNILHLVVGEDIPTNAPDEFRTVKLYMRDKDDNLTLYAHISLPYLINHSEFLDIKDDPRYFFMEDYEKATGSCRYRFMVKPFGDMKGVYRILSGRSFKIRTIEPLCELENNINRHTLIKKNK